MEELLVFPLVSPERPSFALLLAVLRLIALLANSGFMLKKNLKFFFSNFGTFFAGISENFQANYYAN